MPQQINLCTPILLTQKRYFSAQTMAQALAVFVLLGGGLCAYWVWSLNSASDGFRLTLATQAQELASLQAAIAQGKVSSAPLEAALAQQLQGYKLDLQQRQSLMDALQRGLFRPGWGHAARLLLVARSIPAQVWVTDLMADEHQLTLSGFTLEPAALNDWVSRLAASALLQGQQLSTVKVEQASAAALKALGGTPTPAGSAATPATAATARPMWSFTLVSALGKPGLVAGVKP
ncbi:MAG: PilN domain-containing protein [Gammaproteobacteria bacterium]|uniref:PilN domain-containing protein n=1 Tax=Rhodoferax sp. TaxID=50421 RepID=UPI00184BB5BE|nr:PilN domain-containing protein [Rhodoferax sp.]MBU3898039.1 PilN domain-containing protein [Gammaproteobacteria bacterium]MBA3058538.1 PilN domain-containing protein [Rhodoferax sp.]MBU3999204.1 PilN domain-containing protein [Gammaproteobacteria bacterium]MBU4081767.1 PilN domain-containing protein [Gammaproteobacteria bacterium]MBU4112897.1 PilN domain-containing protein [Gammaproteobacteria bacterium]